MSGSGTVNVNFGTFPGSPSAIIAVTGQAGILTSSLVEAWIFGSGGTTDHSEDEHIIENVKVNVGLLIAGTGFTIFCESHTTSMLYGQWQIAWVWV